MKASEPVDAESSLSARECRRHYDTGGYRVLGAASVCLLALIPLVVVMILRSTAPPPGPTPGTPQGCLSVVLPRGKADLDRPFEFTAHLDRDSCDLISARSDQALRLKKVPVGSLVEIKLTSRQELSIRDRGSVSKPFSDDGTADWTWELRAGVKGAYLLSLVVTVRDKESKEVVDESEPLYVWIDVTPTGRQIVASAWSSATSFLDSVPGAIAGLTALLAVASGIWFRLSGRKKAASRDVDTAEPVAEDDTVRERAERSAAVPAAPAAPAAVMAPEEASVPFEAAVTAAVVHATATGDLVWRSSTTPGDHAVDIVGRIVEYNWRDPGDTGNAYVTFVARCGDDIVDEQVRRVGKGNDHSSFRFDLGSGVGAGIEITDVTVQVGLSLDRQVVGSAQTYRPR
ncbi:hypothetical protein [Nocardia wallacei]|uniref:Uncharacterized protein n=1 Tax=Nocardia wallacei TaxID=480035 RepID=A0A7G1KIP1_9NOCA|nr:hypothetical protein [Nocardia wallacei]BCK55097.1 hypothetical protein NWFMUON74_28690 [Nocardia wallacei]